MSESRPPAPALGSHAQWVIAARPEAPPALTQRVTDLLATHPDWAALPLPEALERAGEELLTGVLARSGDDESARDRANALDLLAADACITWAFEASAAEVDAVPARAAAAMRRILSTTGP